MATKTLNTRIALRYDSHDKWLENDPVLLAGEVALSTVSVKQDGTVNFVPSVLIKVGDGTHKYSELDFAYAKAADVLAACKTEEGLTAYITNVINNAGIATTEGLTALAGKVTTAEGKISTLEGKMTTAEGKISANEAAIEALEGLVGEDGVAVQIQNAINALNLANTYAAKSLETTVANHTADTVVHVTSDDKIKWNNALQASDVATGSANGTIAVKGNDVAIKGLGSAAYTESSAYDAAGSASAAEAAAKAYADGLAGNYDAKGAAAAAQSAAETYAKNYADGLAENYDAAGAAAQALTDAKDYTDDQIETWVGDKTVGVQISEAIAAEKLSETYAAKVHTHVKADITDFAHTHEMSEVNGLTDALAGKQAAGDYATKDEAQGYANAKDEAIAAAKKAGDDAQADIDALEEYVGTIPETATATNIVAYVQEKTAGIATDAALGELTGRVADAEGAIEDLEELVGGKNVATQISEAVAAEAAIARAAEKANADAIDAIEADYLKAADKTELQGNIDTVSAAVERLTNGVSADEVDGVNDLIAYVNEHGTEVTGMKKDISDNAAAIAAEKERAEGIESGLEGRLQAVETAIGESGSVADDIAAALAEAKGYTDTEVKELADGAVATNAADIEALEELVGGKNVATQITEQIDALKAGQLKTMQDEIDAVEGRATALEAKSHEHANKAELDKIADGDKAKWDAAVQTVTAGDGLTATKTGTDVAIAFDDTCVFIFDCGDSSNV